MNLTLNNGVVMPALGFGVFQSAPEVTAQAVETALATGYRHIDTAAAHGNEREVGEGLRASGVDRADVFIETKVWISDYGYDETLHAFDKSAGKLGVDQLDLFILHQPVPSAFDAVVDAYRALEQLLADGRVRAIGVSNVMPAHLERLLARTAVVPAVNQIEVHPYFRQTDVLTANADFSIAGRNGAVDGAAGAARRMARPASRTGARRAIRRTLAACASERSTSRPPSTRPTWSPRRRPRRCGRRMSRATTCSSPRSIPASPTRRRSASTTRSRWRMALTA